MPGTTIRLPGLPSLRSRLLFSFWLLILISLWLPFEHYRSEADRDVLDEADLRATRQLDLVEWLLREHGGFAGPGELQRWITDAGRDLGVRITYIGGDGRVAADSEVPAGDVPAMENHAGRPEVVMSRGAGVGRTIRESGTLHRKLLYVARPVDPGSGLPAGTLRLAVSFSVLRDRLLSLASDFFWIVLATFLVTSGVSLLLSRRLRSSIGSLVRVAEAIGQGDYSGRIRDYPGSEFKPLAESINAMAQGIAERIGTIEVQRGRIEAILDGMREGVMLLDREGRVVSMNRAMRSVLPGASEPAGRAPLELTKSPDLQRAVDGMRSGELGGDGCIRMQIELRREKFFHVCLTPVQAGDAGGFVAVFHDISEYMRLSRMRREFVANVSHELKTPLTSIRGYAETLADGASGDRETRRRFLEIILRNTNHMIEMVRQMLSLSKLETEAPARLENVDAGQAVSYAFQILAPEAEAKGIRLVSLLPSPVMVIAAAEDLGQVFRNLVENAVRSSPSGGTVTVSAVEKGSRAEFSVADDGPGIPGESLERVFERFYTLRPEGGGKSGGTGLGLAICRHIVRNFGGEIRAVSPAPGSRKGAAFIFSLARASA